MRTIVIKHYNVSQKLKKLRVNIPVRNLIRQAVQFISSKYMTSNQQNNITHACTLFTDDSIKRVYNILQSNKRIASYKKEGIKQINNLQFNSTKQMIKQLSGLVDKIMGNSVFFVKIVDHVNDVSLDDVEGLQLKQKLSTPQSVKEIDEQTIKTIDEKKDEKKDKKVSKEGDKKPEVMKEVKKEKKQEKKLKIKQIKKEEKKQIKKQEKKQIKKQEKKQIKKQEKKQAKKEENKENKDEEQIQQDKVVTEKFTKIMKGSLKCISKNQDKRQNEKASAPIQAIQMPNTFNLRRH